MALGIAFDIGAYSCKAALLRERKLDPENLLVGAPLLSVAYVEDDGRITINGASEKAERNPKRGIWDVKQKIVLGEDSIPGFSGISPIDVYVEMIKEVMRRSDEQLLKNGDDTIEEIVLTVPAILEDKPEIAGKLKRAAESIKLSNGKNLRVSLVVEPAGAGIFNLDKMYRDAEQKKNGNDAHTIIVFDLGHSTLDVALITSYIGGEKDYELHYFKPDTDIFSRYFDDCIYKEILDELAELGLEKNNIKPRLERTLKTAAKNIKHNLSSELSTTESIEFDGDFVDVTITRERFNELAYSKMLDAVDYVRDAISIAKDKNLKVESIVMAGGGSFMPIVETMLKSVAGDIPVVRSLKPIDAISFGAARYSLMHNMVQRAQYSYGIQLPVVQGTLDRKIRFMLPADSTLPFESKPVKFKCTNRGVFDAILYYVDKAVSDTTVLPVELCNQIRHMNFELPANEEIECTLSIDENHCVTARCKTANGETYVMTSQDPANARSRKE